MTDDRGPDSGSATRNRVGPAGFVIGMGLVSALTDVVYEGTRAVIGPYLVLLGASAGTVGLVTGGGEALALVLRLVTGPVADRTRRPWPQVALGYGLTAVCVPLLALTGAVWPAAALYLGERLGKAVRTPARDVMLAHAAASLGRGRAFGLHKLLDQTGAVVGPLLVAAALLAHPDGYRTGFLLLGGGGLLALVALSRLRRLAPVPADWEPGADVAESKRLRFGTGLGTGFLRYQCFSGLTMLGFATWAVLVVQATAHVGLAPAAVPLLYAVAMGAGGVSALLTGRVYDRRGLRTLAVVPVLAAAVVALMLAPSLPLVVVGSVLWGAVVGVQDSTLRAAVADLVPAGRRGAAYGAFATVQGLAWWVGSVVVGWLGERSTGLTMTYVVVVQLLALVVLLLPARTAATSDRAVPEGH
ncbi:MFS transporter [Lapillicoccus jejuensis]|uniref:Sugar phosphate permease n=1 Tax=Lapillicoccus jejuensis TaxID=402171 RepID=A0A542E060_9MICO|nr:MFS transporter [Lapillicoccus jejuensis]TQJ08564.1 sugar phosphate permease [Lapillicoccus jejuensis]